MLTAETVCCTSHLLRDTSVCIL